MILLDQVSKFYKPQKDGYAPITALDKATLYVKAKEFVVLIGPSGSGKSTILKMLVGQEAPSSGRVVVGGVDIAHMTRKDIPKLRRKIGYIYQDFKLLPKKTVVQNIAFALEMTGVADHKIRIILAKIIKMVGLEGREYSLPNELSGGEMQRVAIARALMHQPKILLADEPTGNLDSDNSFKVIDLLLKINKLGTTVLLTTHDKEVVARLNQRTITVEGGKIYETKRAKTVSAVPPMPQTVKV